MPVIPINRDLKQDLERCEILYKPDPNGESEIPSIYRDPPMAALDPLLDALDPPSSTFSDLSLALILFRAELWIDDPVQSRTVDR